MLAKKSSIAFGGLPSGPNASGGGGGIGIGIGRDRRAGPVRSGAAEGCVNGAEGKSSGCLRR